MCPGGWLPATVYWPAGDSQRLCTIRQADIERVSQIHTQPALNPQSTAKQSQSPPLAHPVGREDNSDEKWQITTRKTHKRKKPAPKLEVHVQNCFMVQALRQSFFLLLLFLVVISHFSSLLASPLTGCAGGGVWGFWPDCGFSAGCTLTPAVHLHFCLSDSTQPFDCLLQLR